MAIYSFFPMANGAASEPARYFICENDAAAMSLAGRMMKGNVRLEVWRGATLVGHASAESKAEEVAVMKILDAIPAVAPSSSASGRTHAAESDAPIETSEADKAADAKIVDEARKAIARSRALVLECPAVHGHRLPEHAGQALRRTPAT